MKNLFRNMTFFLLFVTVMFTVTGCNSDENKVNSNSQLANIKKNMMEDLENFSYDANITVKTGIMDVTTTMNCKEDRKNEIGHCSMSTYGVQTEEYIDYKNELDYVRVYSPYSTDPSNGIWTKNKIENTNTNSWLNLSDYIFNIKEEHKNGGTHYTGTINSKKLASAMASIDSSIDMNHVISDDIEIIVFVNGSGYIENMTFDMEIMGIEENIEVTYKHYNSSGDISIPTEVRG